MSEQKYIAIGDVHGCARSLEALLRKFDDIDDYEDRTIVFVGDYIDRGPDSRGVVDIILEYRKYRDVITLRGNHEQMLLDAYHRQDYSLWMINGGQTTLDSYDSSPGDINIPQEHVDFYKETKLYYDTPEYFFVHAGAPPEQPIEKSLQQKDISRYFLWERAHLNAFETAWEKTVVFGHTPRPHPLVKDKMVGIDTGCVYDRLGYGRLTAALLPEKKFINQICIDQ